MPQQHRIRRHHRHVAESRDRNRQPRHRFEPQVDRPFTDVQQQRHGPEDHQQHLLECKPRSDDGGTRRDEAETRVGSHDLRQHRTQHDAAVQGFDGEQVEQVEPTGNNSHHHRDVRKRPPRPHPECRQQRHGNTGGRPHHRRENDLTLGCEAHARHGDSAKERQENQPPPRLADHPVGQQMAVFVNEQRHHQQRRDDPAKGQHERVKRDDTRHQRHRRRNQRVRAIVGRTRLRLAAQPEDAAPQVGPRQELRQQRPRSPMIGHHQPGAATFGLQRRRHLQQLVVGGLAIDAGPVDLEISGRFAADHPEQRLRGLHSTRGQRRHEIEAIGVGLGVDQCRGHLGALPALVLAFGKIHQREHLFGRRLDQHRGAWRHPRAEPQQGNQQQDERQFMPRIADKVWNHRLPLDPDSPCQVAPSIQGRPPEKEDNP